MAMRLSSPFVLRLAALLVLLTRSLTAVEFVNLACDNDIKQSSKCGAGGVFNGEGALSGTFVCRQRWGGFFSPGVQSVCVPTVLNQVIGYADDTCGCCTGECPKACTCVCNAEEDKVLVAKARVLFGDEYECVTRSKASRYVGDGNNNWSCVEDEACPALAPPEVPEEGNGGSTAQQGSDQITKQENAMLSKPDVEQASLQDSLKITVPGEAPITKSTRKVDPGE